SCRPATGRRSTASGASSSRSGMLDPITLEVVRNRLQYLTQEMSAAIVKTAVSPVVSEARDFSCMLYDADGHIVATAATVPFHFGVSADAIAVVRERFAGRIVAGTHVAAEQVCELETEVGPAAFRQALREIRGLSARVVRRRIRELPTGEYLEQGWAEFDDEAFLVRCRLRVRDGMLEFDYTGSSPQCPYFFNSKPHIVRSELVVRLHQLLAADVPFT